MSPPKQDASRQVLATVSGSAAIGAFADMLAGNENVLPLRPRSLDRRQALQRAVNGTKRTRITLEMVRGLASALDFFLVLGAAALAFKSYVVFNFGGQYALAALVGAAGFVWQMHRADAYSLKRLTSYRWQMSRILAAWGGVIAALLAVAFVSRTSTDYSRVWVLLWAVLTPVLLCAGRLGLASFIRRARESGHLRRNVVIVGANEMTAALIDKLCRNPFDGVSIVGLFDDRHDRVAASVAGHEVLGTTADLADFVRAARVDEVIVALPPAAAPRLSELFKRLRQLPIDLRLSAEPLLAEFPILGVTQVGDATVLEFVERPIKNWHAVAKWLEDKIVALLGIVLMGPLMGLIALLIKLDSAGPVLFVQERFGYNNAVIKVLKFRTMRVGLQDASGGQRTCRGDARVTRVGYYLRKWSLDELPQLFNVLSGAMSIVGPRPHALAMKAGERLYHDAVTDYARRHCIKPGITGWAQVTGLRGEIDSLEKGLRRVEKDLYYIDHWSLAFDFYIMLRSVCVFTDTKDTY
jgi:Undecaprenyl-phosphate glucose phosphotransferase